MDFLDRLRKKPSHVRKGIFISVMLGAFFVVFSFFVLSIDVSFFGDNLSEEESKELPNVFDSLKASLNDVFRTENIKLK